MGVGGEDDRVTAHKDFCQFLITGEQPAGITSAAGQDRQGGDEKDIAYIGIGGKSVFNEFDGVFRFLKTVVEDVKIIVVDDGVMIFDRLPQLFGGKRGKGLVSVDV